MGPLVSGNKEGFQSHVLMLLMMPTWCYDVKSLLSTSAN